MDTSINQKYLNFINIYSLNFFLSPLKRYSVNIVLMNIIEKYFPQEHRERALEEEDNQKNEEALKPGNL